ncbi:MAG: ABC transporter permease [Promicromonosporaceae bacterium]|nr:ABC transporter permease [Promicromonosporaceae bacterium]
MLLYIGRRMIAGLVLFVVSSLITFLLLSMSFDSIIASRLGPGATPEQIADMAARLGMDRPVLIQYFNWLGNLFTGDMGSSFFTGADVASQLPQRISVTLSVVLPALTLSAIVAVGLGVWAASRGGWVDKVSQGFSLLGNLIPNLLVAIGLVSIFAIELGWLPATGFVPIEQNFGGWLRSIIIPVITIFIGGAANIANQVRGTMIDELRKDYVRTLRTRGVSPRAILLKHALRNAAGPAVTVLGLTFITMFGGALIIEQVFALPGFGTFAFTAATSGDYTVMLGVMSVGIGLTVGMNLLVDIVNGWLNPKARVY